MRVATPITKQEILGALETLPKDASIEDAMERLYFLAKVERGLRQADRAEGLSHDEITSRFLR